MVSSSRWSVGLLAWLALGAACVGPSSHAGSGRLMHSVAFWFKPDAPPTIADDLIATYHAVIGEVPGVVSLCVGKPVPRTRDVVDDSYDVFSTTVFVDREAERGWQSHPVHLALIERFGPWFERVVVYDTIE